MLDYLIDRDQEDGLRYAMRHVAGPDGAPLSLRCYRLVWRWFDHLTAYEFGPDADEILETAHGIALQYALPLEIALGYAVTRHVYELEQLGGDVTDDDLELVASLRTALSNVHTNLGASPSPW